MSIKKCLWDLSHEFEDEGDDYRKLCPTCYHNIFIDIFKNITKWDDFIDKIEEAKSAFKFVSALDKFYKNNIMKLASTKNDEEEAERHCLICDGKYKVTPADHYRYLCGSCAHKYYFPLKLSRSSKEIKDLILDLKKVFNTTEQLMEKLIEIAKES